MPSIDDFTAKTNKKKFVNKSYRPWNIEGSILPASPDEEVIREQIGEHNQENDPKDLVMKDTEEPKPPVQKRTLSRLIDAAVEIQGEPETPENEKAFSARQLILATLPHSNPGNVSIWQRRNGNITLSIRPGFDDKKNEFIGYPYGTIPRLLLFWLTTEALRTRSRRIELGKSLAEFMNKLGLNPGGGGPRSDGARLRDQMNRLFRAIISVDIRHIKGHRWQDMQIAPKGELWWDTRHPEQRTIWQDWIELSEDFYNGLIKAPVPVDMRALQGLKNSALALDLYSWSTYRTFSLNHSKLTEQFIPWVSLMEQLGAEYGTNKNFKAKAKAAFRKVKAVYPGLNFEEADGGFIIKQGRTAVTHRPKKG